MRNGLATETVCKNLAFAEMYGLVDFKKEAIKYICMNANAVINVSFIIYVAFFIEIIFSV